MRRYLPLCVLSVLFAYLSGCGEAPNRPSVVTDRPVNPPKTSARYIQVPWDISLFFNIPGGAVVAGATTAATVGGAAEGDNLTGTYTNSTGFGGTLSGVLTGTLENGTFNGTLKTITASGCPAERQFSGPLNTQTLNWTPGNEVNNCGGTSPLTGVAPIQVTSAPPSAPPPCTYSATIGETSFAAAGGSGTVTVTAGTGCIWFATSSASFVTVSIAQGSGNGSVQYTVAANTSTTARTATLAVAGQSFTITQAGVPAPVCTYSLNDAARTFDAASALGGVDMRAPVGCAWTAVSDAPWLTITSGSAGSGNGAINFALTANPELSQRVGRITAQGQIFTVTQSGISCVYTVTPPATNAFPSLGGTGTATVATQAACAWAATSNVPWITITPPPGGTGNGSASFTVVANTEAAPRAGVLTVAGREIAITQAPTACTYTVTATPTPTSFPAEGGNGSVSIVAPSGCPWTAAVSATSAPGTWLTLLGPTSGTGSGTVAFTVAQRSVLLDPPTRTGTITVAGQSITVTQTDTRTATVAGRVTNSVNGGPIAGATITVGNLTGTSGQDGRYSIANVPFGAHRTVVSAPEFTPVVVNLLVGGQPPYDPVLTPAGTPALTFTYNANPVFPNETNRHCGEPDNVWCWSYTNTIQNTGGATLTVTSWEIDLYGVENNLEQQTIFTAADFARFYNGATGVPAGGTAVGGAIVYFNSSSGGTIEIIVSGTDVVGRTYRFVATPRLSAQERAVGVNVVPSGAKSTAPAPSPRPLGGR